MDAPREVFALDIGTRKIAGILVEQRGDSCQIQAAAVEEQAPGAMVDGQIHDVTQVAKTIAIVRDRLTAATGKELTQVAVAAAGRSLVTADGGVQRSLLLSEPITRELVTALELEAVDAAVRQLAQDAQRESYLCVGYHVRESRLDGQRLASLIGQRGRRAQIDVIATLLPRIVVDSLRSALGLAGLQMASITLEPNAAINVIVPPSMRRLNLALVDIGAGTSDIAVTRESKVLGFGMVPVAGDEVTGAIADAFLLDFSVAERVKRQLEAGPINCQDVVGNELELLPEQVQEAAAPAVDKLAAAIAQVILQLNGGRPQAVLCIGGGSLTTALIDALSRHLELPANRIGIRDRDSIPHVKGCPEFTGPMTITPIGIAMAALQNQALQAVPVRINGTSHQLLQLARRTVRDILLAAGFSPKQLFGLPGPSLAIEVNGHPVVVPGTLGEPAPIQVNGQPADLHTQIHPHDEITIGPARAGSAPTVLVKDLVKDDGARKCFTINGERREFAPQALVNGEVVGPDHRLQDGDQVTTQGMIKTVADLLMELGYEAVATFPYTIDDVEHYWQAEPEVFVNGRRAVPATTLASGDEISIRPRSDKPTLSMVAARLGLADVSITVDFNGQAVTLTNPALTRLRVNGESIHQDRELQAHDRLEVLEPRPFIVNDIFRFVSFDPPKKGGSLKIKVNGQAGGFTTPIDQGDSITITFG
ncbi:MAG: pilus assembly protein PilM [Firmicutes bacterium]|jgi:cell division ATPase FtsA|nr:pilus assembly protein PilM [Bacillota bacterium]